MALWDPVDRYSVMILVLLFCSDAERPSSLMDGHVHPGYRHPLSLGVNCTCKWAHRGYGGRGDGGRAPGPVVTRPLSEGPCEAGEQVAPPRPGAAPQAAAQLSGRGFGAAPRSPWRGRVAVAPGWAAALGAASRGLWIAGGTDPPAWMDQRTRWWGGGGGAGAALNRPHCRQV